MLKPIKRIFICVMNKTLLRKQRIKEKRHFLVGPAELWKMKQDFQIEFLLKQGLKKEDRLLDIGCGTLRGGVPIIKYLESGKYHGIDVREEAIEQAREELKEEKLQAKQPMLYSFDRFSELNLPVKFDVIFSFSVLIHMKDEILEECISFVKASLKEEGVFYANVNIGARESRDWLEFPVMFKPLSFYEEVAAKYNLKVDFLGELKTLGHISGDELQDKQQMLRFTHAG